MSDHEMVDAQKVTRNNDANEESKDSSVAQLNTTNEIEIKVVDQEKFYV